MQQEGLTQASFVSWDKNKIRPRLDDDAEGLSQEVQRGAESREGLHDLSANLYKKMLAEQQFARDPPRRGLNSGLRAGKHL